MEDDSPVTISGTTDAEPGQTVTVELNGNTYTTTVNPDCTWSVDVPVVDVQGLDPSETVTASVSDVAGNPSVPATTPLTYDPLAPSAPVVVISEDANDDGYINTAELVGNVNITVTLPPEAVAGDTITVTDGVTTVTAVLTPADISSGEFLTELPALSDGTTTTVTATVTDIAGNASPSTTDTAIIDVTAPSPGVAPNLIATSDSGPSDTDDITNDATPTFDVPTGTGAPGDTVTIYANGTPVGTGTVNPDGSFSIETTTIPDGTYDITYTFTDEAGNEGLPSPALPIVIDTGIPTAITLDGPIETDDVVDATEAGSVVISGSSAEPTSTVMVTFTDSLGNVVGPIAATIDPSGNWTTPGVDLTTLVDGPVQVTAIETDIAGNVGTPVTSVIELDAIAPTATDDSYTADENVGFTGNIITDDTGNGIDTDPTGIVVVESINDQTLVPGQTITLPSGALLTVNEDGSFAYDPNGVFDSLKANETAIDTFSYTTTDGVNESTPGTVVINIRGVNEVPIAGDDDVKTPIGQSITVPVLENDVDPNGEPLTVMVLNQPEGGTATVNSDGSITFEPNPGFTGTTQIQYLVEDPHGGTSTATLTVEVFLPYTYDSINDFSRGFGSSPGTPGTSAGGEDGGPGNIYQQSKQPLLTQRIHTLAPDPIFSGQSRPGSSVVGRVYDGQGRLIGEQFASTDPGGNWLMQFRSIDRNTTIRVEFEYTSGGADMYGYFGLDAANSTYQTLQPVSDWNESFSEGDATRRAPQKTLEQIHQQNQNPLGFG